MALLNKQTVLEHLYKRLIETANNNVGFKCDAGIVFEEIATDRIKTWLDEVQTVDADPVRHGKWIKHMKVGHHEKFDSYTPWWQCSECGQCYDATFANICNYCYYCGAKMDGAERKEE